MWKLLALKEIFSSRKKFHESVLVWIQRPNVCNKIISCCTLQPPNFLQSDFISDSNISLEKKNFVHKLLIDSKIKCSNCNKDLQFLEKTETINCGVRKFVPRRHDLYQVGSELIVVLKNGFLFLPLDESNTLFSQATAYLVTFCSPCNEKEETENLISLMDTQNSGTLSIFTLNYLDISFDHNCSSLNKTKEITQPNCFVTSKWLLDKLFPTLCKWCLDESQNLPSNFHLPPSLSLIDKEKYSTLYQNLKVKYGVPISQAWPEVTDPQKFVYEDVAIAAYLLLLWEKERNLYKLSAKQSFADLGCGNGLLVYILTSEGHNGIGYDIRKRKIWDAFGSQTQLKEIAITPNKFDLIQDYDWLLGNHSDELTPWIPLMASKYNKRFWVLPCCFFDFHAKYERAQSTNGQYHDYLAYVKSIGQQSGFDVETDVMRIPSTKRVCFVGMNRVYDEGVDSEVKQKVDNFIENLFEMLDEKSAVQFVPRSAKIEVRNCTKLDRNIQNEVVTAISTHLLSKENQIKSINGEVWNRGGKIAISDAVQLLSDSVRTTMKRECGGLQTLLRNNNQIFEVNGGQVQIRNWASLEEAPRKKKRKQNASVKLIKTKKCWFFDHHPDGCPRSASECTFLHSEETTNT